MKNLLECSGGNCHKKESDMSLSLNFSFILIIIFGFLRRWLIFIDFIHMDKNNIKCCFYCYGGKLQEMPYFVHRFWTIDETKAFFVDFNHRKIGIGISTKKSEEVSGWEVEE